MTHTGFMRAMYLSGAVCAVSVVFLALPAVSHAAENLTVQTVQVVPPNGTGCQPLSVPSVTPYVYDGQLHSFDVVIGDPYYVSLIGAAGRQNIPFNHMTRSALPNGQVRIHVDIESEPLQGSLPVSLTLLSAKPGQPVCAALVSFSVPGNADGAGSGAGSNGGVSSGPRPVVPAGSTGTGVKPGALPSGEPIPATNTAATSAAATGTAALCTSSGSFQLWTVLIVFFVVVSVIVAIAKETLIARYDYLPAIIIGSALAVLLAFWLFSTTCRSSGWVPVILILITAIALLYIYYDRTSRTNVLLLGAKRE